MEPYFGVAMAVAFVAVVVGLVVMQRRGPLLFLASSLPSIRLASATLENATRATLTTSALSGSHGVWLDVNVVSLASNSQWSADVSIDWRAGASSGTERFPIGYDGDGHVTGPGAHGILFSPHASDGSSGDRGLLSLFDLPGVAPGAAIDVDITLKVTSEIGPSTFVAFVGLIPDGGEVPQTGSYRG